MSHRLVSNTKRQLFTFGYLSNHRREIHQNYFLQKCSR
jgi:hypothetical protein